MMSLNEEQFYKPINQIKTDFGIKVSKDRSSGLYKESPRLQGKEISRDEIKKENKQSERLSMGDTVRILSLIPKNKKWEKYYGFKLIGKKGKVIQIWGTKKEPYQGVKVKFPCIWIVSENGRKPVYGFEWSFYKEEIERIDEELEFRQPPKKILKGRALESRKKVVQELRKKGESIEDLAKRYNVSKRTIWYWLK